MTIALLSHIAGKATTGSIDTTGADLLLHVADSPNNYNYATDSKSNTWVNNAQFKNTVGAFFARLNHVLAPSSVGTGHTFSTTPNIFYLGLNAASFSGVDVLDQAQSVKEDTAAATTHAASAGAVTPTVDGCLVVTAICFIADPGTLGVPSGFSILDSPYDPATTWPVAWAYEIQTTATARTPSWTSTNSVASCGATIVFRQTAGGGGGSIAPISHYYQMMRSA